MKPILCLLLLAAPGGAATTLLDQGYHRMYNMDFAGAHRSFAEYRHLHPDDPLAPVSDAAAYLFAEFDRLHILQSEFFTHDQHFVTDNKLTADPEVKRQFEDALETARKLCERAPESDNALFAAVLRGGLRSDYMALIEKRYVPSLKEMKGARVLAQKLLARNPDFADAWLAVGVENYMLSIKAAPMRFFLRLAGAETDRQKGLEKLRLTAEKGKYLAPFARLMLAVAAMRDNDRQRAGELLRGLVHEYPRNVLYAQELARLQPGVTRP